MLKKLLYYKMPQGMMIYILGYYTISFNKCFKIHSNEIYTVMYSRYHWCQTYWIVIIYPCKYVLNHLEYKV